MSRYVFVVATPDESGSVDVKLYTDDHSLPGEVTSTEVRRAKQAPAEMRTRTLNGSWLGWLPVKGR